MLKKALVKQLIHKTAKWAKPVLWIILISGILYNTILINQIKASIIGLKTAYGIDIILEQENIQNSIEKLSDNIKSLENSTKDIPNEIRGCSCDYDSEFQGIKDSVLSAIWQVEFKAESAEKAAEAAKESSEAAAESAERTNDILESAIKY